MRFVSLFAGVGGFDLGFERAGMACVGQVEIDPKARAVLEKHWPDVPKHDDVQTAKGWADEHGLVGAVDVVCGGFPCQDLSVAGKRAGLDGSRSGLFWDALAFSTHVEARWIVLENVPGLLSSNGGRDFGTVLTALADAGFDHIEWRVLDSQFFGVPQRRRRVFIVAGRGVGADGGGPVLAEREGVCGDSASFGEARSEVAGNVERGVAGCRPVADVCGTLSGGAHPGGFNGQDAYSGQLVVCDVAPSVMTRVRHDPDTAEGLVVVGFNWQNGGGYGNANPGLGITEEGTGPLSTSQVPAVAGGGMAVRRLTPRECERLQGFPDDWTVDGSDSARYKQMGNAVTVNVVEWIGEGLMLRDESE